MNIPAVTPAKINQYTDKFNCFLDPNVEELWGSHTAFRHFTMYPKGHSLYCSYYTAFAASENS